MTDPEPQPAEKQRILSADPRDNVPPTPKWVPRSEPEIAHYWLDRIRDQLTGEQANIG